MRSIWKGSISFGLINLPVRMFPATENKRVSFRNLHRDCHTPLQYRKYCPHCNTEVTGEDIVRGYEYQRGTFVILEDDELENIPLKTTRTIDILDFIDLSAVDPIYFNKTYYLGPSEGGEKAYLLLREAMQETGKAAISKVTIRSKENLACIRVHRDKIVVMETMFYPDEIREATDLELERTAGEIHLGKQEQELAVELINNLSTDFEPENYEDNYREELMEIIKKKIEGQEVAVPRRAQDEGKVVDLIAALKESVEATGTDKADPERGEGIG